MYEWVLFVHVGSVLVFMLAHGIHVTVIGMSVLGLGGIAVILWLMMFKPF